MLRKLLDIISNILPLNPLAGKEEALAQLNPDKIYVENISALLDVSYNSAKAICETATRQGLFNKGIEVKCPDGRVAFEAPEETRLPETVTCWVEEEGHLEAREMDTNALEKNIYYRLSDSSRVAHA